MNYKSQIIEIYKHKISEQDIKFLGRGTDSDAFEVKNDIIRFPHNQTGVYFLESDVCNFIRKTITISIPNTKVISKNGMFYVIHKKITGDNWSWHKFSLNKQKQDNLAKSIALFLDQLHNKVDVKLLTKKIPATKKTIPFVPFNKVKNNFSVFCTKHQITFLEKQFNKILSVHTNTNDLVLNHMGVKCANSCVDKNGNLIGVFDFCNCGIYERYRDFGPLYQSRNNKLFNLVIKYYSELSGIKINKKRIADLVAIGILWRKRWNNNFTKCTLGGGNPKNLKSEIMNSLGYFYKMPRFLYKLIYLQLSIHEYLYNKKYN